MTQTTLPALNPMSRAPRTGGQVILMLADGTIMAALWQGGSWWKCRNGVIGESRIVALDKHCLGWWPTPELIGERVTGLVEEVERMRARVTELESMLEICKRQRSTYMPGGAYDRDA